MNSEKVKRIVAQLRKLRPVWTVYVLANNSRKEVYFGVSHHVEKRFKEHAGGSTEAIAHWDFEQDQIEEGVIDKGLQQGEATKRSHEYENIGQEMSKEVDEFNGYKFIQTRGI